MIDVRFLSLFLLNQKNINTDTFITSFKIIYLIKIIKTDFTKFFFEYTIIKSNLDLKCYKSDFFVYITPEKYILDKYYRIIINMRAFKQLTAKYR